MQAMSAGPRPYAPGERTDLVCPECGALMSLRQSRFGLFYSCSTWPKCTCKHGAHADGSPLGVPGDADVRRARIRAHASFDRIWKRKIMTRKQAYRWLRRRLRMTKAQCHIGKMGIDDCERVAECCEAFING